MASSCAHALGAILAAGMGASGVALEAQRLELGSHLLEHLSHEGVDGALDAAGLGHVVARARAPHRVRKRKRSGPALLVVALRVAHKREDGMEVGAQRLELAIEAEGRGGGVEGLVTLVAGAEPAEVDDGGADV